MHDLDREVVTDINNRSEAADEVSEETVRRVLDSLERLGFDVRSEYDLGQDDDDDDDDLDDEDDEDDLDDDLGDELPEHEYDDDD